MGRKQLPGQTLLAFNAAGDDDVALAQADDETQPADILTGSQQENNSEEVEQHGATQLDSVVDESENQLCPSEDGPEASNFMSRLLNTARPVCTKCGLEVDPVKCQLKGKTGGSYLCNACNAKVTMISKRWGHGILQEFKGLPREEQTEFWASLHNKNNQQVADSIADSLSKKRSDSIKASSKGEWLPLSVWAAKGFSADLILEKCKDTQEHPILGTCYRVCVQSLDRNSVATEERKRVLQSLEGVRNVRGNGPGSGGPSIADDDVVPPDGRGSDDSCDAKDSGSSASDSSSSSSSSSSGREKQKKKSKRNKKSKGSKKLKKKQKKLAKKKEKESAVKAQKIAEAKAEAAQRKAEASAKAAEEKEAKQLKATATRAKIRLQPTLLQLDQARQHCFCV